VVKNEQQVMRRQQIYRELYLDLFVPSGDGVVVEDSARRLRHQQALSRPPVYALEPPRLFVVRIPEFDQAGDVPSPGEHLLGVEVQIEGVDVQMVDECGVGVDVPLGAGLEFGHLDGGLGAGGHRERLQRHQSGGETI
jgi:hypothetical protein